ncbi:MAG: 50S ribosomal protein L13 [Candidatus Firestonebacteria bacterium]
MKTYYAKPKDVVRKWYLIDIKDKILGRVATKIAMILMGKNKPTYTPNTDTGDYVIAINAGKVKLTGKKLEQKTDYTHSGYPGGHRFTPYKVLIAKNPERAIELAVKGMLPKTKLGDKMLKKLKAYKGEVHPHGNAKNIEVINI